MLRFYYGKKGGKKNKEWSLREVVHFLHLTKNCSSIGLHNFATNKHFVEYCKHLWFLVPIKTKIQLCRNSKPSLTHTRFQSSYRESRRTNELPLDMPTHYQWCQHTCRNTSQHNDDKQSCLCGTKRVKTQTGKSKRNLQEISKLGITRIEGAINFRR